MENPAPFDLNQAVLQWREQLAVSPVFRGEDLDELENHLRDSIASLEIRGLNPQEAFWIARHRLGGSDLLQREFGKLNTGHIWTERAFWMVFGSLGIAAVGSLANSLSKLCAAALLKIPALAASLDLATVKDFTSNPTLVWTASAFLYPILFVGMVILLCRYARRTDGAISRVAGWAKSRPIMASLVIGLAILLNNGISAGTGVWMAYTMKPEVVAGMWKWQAGASALTFLLWPVVLGWLLVRVVRDRTSGLEN